MQQMTRAISFGLLVLLLISLCGAALAVAPEDILLQKAQQAITDKKTDDAITTLELLRQQNPASDATIKGDVILYGLYLDKNDTTHAGVIGNDVCTRWPRSEAAWSVIAANCANKAKTSPAGALAALEKAAAANLLPAAEHYPAIALRLQYMQTARPDDFLPEGMKVMQRIPDVAELPALTVIAGIAAHLYQPLMAEKRFDDAGHLNDALQEKLALLGDKGAVADRDTTAYLTALLQTDPVRYRAALAPLIDSVAWATTGEEFARALTLAQQGYSFFLHLKSFDDAQKLHAKIQLALAKQPDNAALRRTDISHYLGALQAGDAAAYAALLQANMETVKTAKTPAELLEPIWIAMQSYPALCRAKKVEEEKAQHQLICAAITRAGVDEAMKLAELLDYATALRSDAMDSSYLPELLPYLRNIEKVNDDALYYQLYCVIDFRALQHYHLSTRDILELYEKVDCDLTRRKWEDKMIALNLSTVENMLRWDNTVDMIYIDDYAPKYVQALSATSSMLHLRYGMLLANCAYSSLLPAGKYDTAQAMHAQLDGLLGKLPDKTLFVCECGAYDTSMAQADPKRYSEHLTALVQRLAITNDADEARIDGKAIGIGYAIVMQHESVDAAKILHTQVQAGLLRCHLTPECHADDLAYLTALSAASPVEYVLAARPLVAGITTANSVEEGKTNAALAALIYLPLAQQEQMDDVRALHQTVQAALARLKLTPEAAGDDAAYFAALVQASPNVYITEALPRAQAVKDANTAEAVKLAMGYTQNLYAPMMKMGRFDEVLALHQQMQASLDKLALKDDAGADEVKYKASFSLGALDAMLTLYKRAEAKDDKAGAKKWLGQLNAVAPESQQASQARAINRAMAPDPAVK